MAAPSIPGRDRKAIRRRPGKQMVEGKSFRLADEVRSIQRRAADRHGRVVTVGQLVLLSTETGDAWLLDPSDQLAARLARDGDPEPVHIEENDTSFVINWKGNYRIEGPAFIYSDIPIARPGASQPSSDTPRTCSRHRPKISNIFLITRQRQPVLASGKASGWSSAQRMRGGGSWFGDRIGD